MAKIPEGAKKVFKGIIFDVYQWEQEMFDGSKSIFEGIKRYSTIQVIAVTEEGKILMIKERQPLKDFTIGFVGGRSDEGETPQETAKRELFEETGYKGDSLELYTEKDIGTSKMEWYIYTFIVKNTKKVGEQILDKGGEDIEVFEVTKEEFLELDKNEIIEKNLKKFIMELKNDENKMKEFFNRLGI